MSSTDTRKEVYLLAQEHCGLKVGDWVRVTRKAENHEAGWDYFWAIGANKSVGNIYRITCINKWGIFLENHEGYTFPYFVLEKVEKPAHEFKPFDRVLVRDNNHCIWTIDFYAYHITDSLFPYKTLAGGYCQCIPYEGNEHLVGTTNKPEE